MIFHHLHPLKPDGASGSQVRPYQMCRAFEALGFQVEPVVGLARDRKAAIKRIKRQIEAGRRFDFVYSESSSAPTLLTEPHHFPTHPALDFGFFKWLKHHNIPIGLFYRDVHWRFRQYRDQVAWYKRVVAVPLYWYDWLAYRRWVDCLFLPSLAMKSSLPGVWDDNRLWALPPGCIEDAIAGQESDRLREGDLALLYIGGVIPPLYDLTFLFKVIDNLDGVHLTLCCRQPEWAKARSYYEPFNAEKIQVVHLSGPDLRPLYARADLFVLLWQPYAYLDFAMPIKIFEAISYGLPIFTTDGTETARFVGREGIGWLVSTPAQASNLLLNLKANPHLIAQKRCHVKQIRQRHTWQARAQTVVDALTGPEAA